MGVFFHRVAEEMAGGMAPSTVQCQEEVTGQVGSTVPLCLLLTLWPFKSQLQLSMRLYGSSGR